MILAINLLLVMNILLTGCTASQKHQVLKALSSHLQFVLECCSEPVAQFFLLWVHEENEIVHQYVYYVHVVGY